MNYNIYFSLTGGTKKVADILVANLGEKCREIDLCREIESLTLQAEDVCLVSVPSFTGRVPQIAVERIKKIEGNGAKAILKGLLNRVFQNDGFCIGCFSIEKIHHHFLSFFQRQKK